jgi:CheY-like chemotaxis protein
MDLDRPILLFESDQPVLSSLQFALVLDGLAAEDGAADGADPSAACCLVVDQRYRSDGLAFLAGLRANGCAAPAILLATNPSGHTRSRAAALGAVLIEKPLLDDELARSLHLIVKSTEAA